jgi:hypothetical protein
MVPDASDGVARDAGLKAPLLSAQISKEIFPGQDGFESPQR